MRCVRVDNTNKQGFTLDRSVGRSSSMRRSQERERCSQLSERPPPTSSDLDSWQRFALLSSLLKDPLTPLGLLA